MLERDYIMRLIREFMAALLRMLEKKEIKDRREELQRMYEQYLGEYTLYHTTTMDEVIESFDRFAESERIHRMEMLAELYYAEADMTTEPQRSEMLRRSLLLFDFIDRKGKTFSFDRLHKMEGIRERLGNQ